ncbi:MAG: tetratricopeptide repeat protein [Phycisphaerales bacterium]|nr:tetratricopeptide repeat protein [Phycisphaerales bacterium]
MSVYAAGPVAKSAGPATAPAPMSVEELQSRAWTLFYGGDFKSAAEGAAKLLTLPASSDPAKWEAAHCQARCLWAMGDAASRTQAQKLWTDLAKATPTPTSRVKVRQVIAQSLVLAPGNSSAAGDPAKVAKAISLLENIVQSDSAGTATAEAAIELGMRYIAAKRFDDAKHMLEFVEKYLSKENIVRLETSEGAAITFRRAAKDALKQLEFAKNVGMAAFEKAEDLRKAEKFAEALAAYQAIIKDSEAQNGGQKGDQKNTSTLSDYAVRSDLAIGQCYVGLNKPLQAVEHWKRFVGAAPAGAWRGQAYAAMIDLQLERLLDLPAAVTYADMADNALKTALADEKIAATWKPSLFDIYLRIGTVRLLQQKPSDAATAFEQAKKATQDKKFADGLDPLIAAAKTNQPNQPLIPADAVVGAMGLSSDKTLSDKATLVLSLAVIDNVAKKFAAADALFDRLLTDKLLKRTPAQEGFATFGKALVLLSNAKSDPDQTKKALLTALKTYPQGSWQDETLYQLAAFIQQQAEATFKKEEYATKHTAPDQPQTQRNLPKQDKAADERRARMIAAAAEALPYWAEVLKTYPKSPRCEPALYYVGVIQHEKAKINASNEERFFKEAAASLNRFCDAYPKSPFAGDAHARQMDIALEALFDLKLAGEKAEKAIQWVKTVANASQTQKSTDTTAPVSLWCGSKSGPSPAFLERFRYECGLRAGLVAYLNEKYDVATENFRLAGAPTLDDKLPSNATAESVGMSVLISAIQKKRVVWREDAVQMVNNERQKTAMKLADLYLFVQRPDRTINIYNRFLANDPLLGTIVPAAKSYAKMQLGWAYSRDTSKLTLAKEYLNSAYDPESANMPWVPFALMRLGSVEYNNGSPEKALPHFERILKLYPDSNEAKRALYFYAITTVKLGKFDLAQQACQQFMGKYPNDVWIPHVKSIMANAMNKNSSKQDVK